MINIKNLVLGQLQVNCYVIEDVDTGYIAIVDPGDSSTVLSKLITEKSDKIKYILLTHGHFDHIGYAKELKSLTNAKVVISKTDEPFLSDGSLNLSLMFFGKSLPPVTADITLTDGDELILGNTAIKFIATAGHTAGSGCYIADNSIFTGDTLMKLSMGRTDFPTSSNSDMLASLKKLYNLNQNYTVYPGHGGTSTLEYERKYNPYFNNINK